MWSNPVLPPTLAGTQMWSNLSYLLNNHAIPFLLNNWTYPPTPPHVLHLPDVPLL